MRTSRGRSDDVELLIISLSLPSFLVFFFQPTRVVRHVDDLLTIRQLRPKNAPSAPLPGPTTTSSTSAAAIDDDLDDEVSLVVDGKRLKGGRSGSVCLGISRAEMMNAPKEPSRGPTTTSSSASSANLDGDLDDDVSADGHMNRGRREGRGEESMGGW